MDDIFEKIIRREIPAEIVYEDDDFVAFLDINPVNPGHTLVVPKRKSTNLLDADEATLCAIGPVVQKVARAVMAATGAPACNLIANNNAEAGQVVFHMHWHVIPRHADDGHQHWPGTPYADGAMAQVAQTIRNQFYA